MDILKPIRKPIQERIEKVQLLMRDIGTLKDVHAEEITALTELRRVQMMIIDDILLARDTTAKYRGNEYQNYEAAVTEIDKKYNGKADWGVLQTGNIIDVRAAMIIGEGVKIVKKKEDAEKEVLFAKKLFEYNKLDGEMAQEFAKEAEIEGKILIKLVIDKYAEVVKEKIKVGMKDQDFRIEGMVSTRFIPWTQNKYKIRHAKEDYTDYTSATWRPRSGKEEKLEPSEFVYAKFGGRINKPNDAQPRIMKCLTQIESLDKALRDWREKNRLFAFPTPHFEVETKEEAQEIMDEIEKNPNFKIKKMFAHTGKFGFAEPTMSGMTSLENEIIRLANFISGTTGVPIHYLGLPDQLANRSVAETLVPFVFYTTVKERMIWKAVYEEILSKGMALYNTKFNAQKAATLDPSKIGVVIPFISEDEWLHFEKVILPAWLAGKVSNELALSLLPGVDVEEELRRLGELEESELTALEKKLAEAEAELAAKDQEDQATEEII